MEPTLNLITGVYYYPQLPDTAALATINDFYYSDGRVKQGMWFLVYGHYDNVYDAYQVKDAETIEHLQPFIAANMVYVKR